MAQRAENDEGDRLNEGGVSHQVHEEMAADDEDIQIDVDETERCQADPMDLYISKVADSDEKPVPVGEALARPTTEMPKEQFKRSKAAVLATKRSIDCVHQIKDPDSDTDAASDKAQAGAIPASASLEKYILQAESLFGFHRPSDIHVFKCDADVATPRLVKNRSNRILVYTGCFNPPHRGHRELLLHTFLRTDCKTISAMIVPRDDGRLGNKLYTNASGFNKQQRMKLWADELLQRFSWVFPGYYQQVEGFMKLIRVLANADGYRLSFTAVRGADHTNIEEEPDWSYGTGSLITSDITRPSRLLITGGAEPPDIPGCRSWRKILPMRSVKRVEGVNECWPCWPCWKLSTIYPDFWKLDSTIDWSVMHDKNQDIKDILDRCHQARGIVWCAHRKHHGGILWLLPSGRQYPVDETRPAISSTMVRKLLADYPGGSSGDHVALYESLKDLVFNPGYLITMLGLNKCWLPRNKLSNSDWQRVSNSGKADDDGIVSSYRTSKRLGELPLRRVMSMQALAN